MTTVLLGQLGFLQALKSLYSTIFYTVVTSQVIFAQY